VRLLHLGWVFRKQTDTNKRNNSQLSHTKIPAVARVEPTVLVVTNFESHPRSMIFISSEKAYATSY